jgi:hypothetical protein
MPQQSADSGRNRARAQGQKKQLDAGRLLVAAPLATGRRRRVDGDGWRQSSRAHGAEALQQARERAEGLEGMRSSPRSRWCRRRRHGRPGGGAMVTGSFAGLREDGVGGGDSSAPRPIPLTGKLGEARWSRWCAQLGAGVAGATTIHVGRG